MRSSSCSGESALGVGGLRGERKRVAVAVPDELRGRHRVQYALERERAALRQDRRLAERPDAWRARYAHGRSSSSSEARGRRGTEEHEHTYDY